MTFLRKERFYLILVKEVMNWSIYHPRGPYHLTLPRLSNDGHDKPFFSKAITTIDNFKRVLSDTDITD